MHIVITRADTTITIDYLEFQTTIISTVKHQVKAAHLKKIIKKEVKWELERSKLL